METGQRRFRRLEFQAPAFIVDGDRTVYGEVENLSNLGMYVRTPKQLDLQATVMISVYLLGAGATAAITVPATVVRSSKDGMGFCSPHINIMSFLQLQNLLTCNANSGVLVNEFCRYADSAREKYQSYPLAQQRSVVAS
jgi:hypothetical protein